MLNATKKRSAILKSFSLKYKDQVLKLNEFREGIYSVGEARKEAQIKLKELVSNHKDLRDLKNGNDKYKFKNLFDLYLKQKIKNGLSAAYTKKITQMCEKYLLPSLANRDVKDIRYSDLLEIFNAIYNPHNPRTSRLETIHRLIKHLENIFDLAYKDRYIDFNPAYKLGKEFPSSKRFNRDNNQDTRQPALIDEKDIKEFIKDLKNNNSLDIQTKRAIYLQILSINRPFNTASAKWAHIDFEKRLWTIPASEMKTKIKHEIPLNDFMLKILKEQYLFSGENEFVFPAYNTLGHIHRDSLSKAIRNLGGKTKWQGKASSHGFRATFKTICTLHESELFKLGITEKVIEAVQSHQERNPVKLSYERQRANLEQKARLLEWYANFLNDLEDLGL